MSVTMAESGTASSGPLLVELLQIALETRPSKRQGIDDLHREYARDRRDGLVACRPSSHLAIQGHATNVQ